MCFYFFKFQFEMYKDALDYNKYKPKELHLFLYKYVYYNKLFINYNNRK